MFKTTHIGVTGARVLAFRGTGLSPEFASGAQVLVVDRKDGMGDFFLARRAVQMTQTFREGSLDVIIEKDAEARVVAKLDCSGSSNLELVRRLNHTGFRGRLVFVGPPTARTATLLRLLGQLVIDFEIAHTTFEALDDSLPMTFNAA